MLFTFRLQNNNSLDGTPAYNLVPTAYAVCRTTWLIDALLPKQLYRRVTSESFSYLNRLKIFSLLVVIHQRLL